MESEVGRELVTAYRGYPEDLRYHVAHFQLVLGVANGHEGAYGEGIDLASHGFDERPCGFHIQSVLLPAVEAVASGDVDAVFGEGLSFVLPSDRYEGHASVPPLDHRVGGEGRRKRHNIRSAQEVPVQSEDGIADPFGEVAVSGAGFALPEHFPRIHVDQHGIGERSAGVYAESYGHGGCRSKDVFTPLKR